MNSKLTSIVLLLNLHVTIPYDVTFLMVFSRKARCYNIGHNSYCCIVILLLSIYYAIKFYYVYFYYYNFLLI